MTNLRDEEQTHALSTASPMAVLVTGGAKRIGANIVTNLWNKGANVIVHYHNSKAEAYALADKFNQQRPGSITLVAGNLIELDLEQFSHQVLDQYGQLNAIVNNASMYYPTSLQQLEMQEWLDMMHIHATVPLFLAKYLAQPLKEARGSIVNIVDTYRASQRLNYVSYAGSKGSLLSINSILAREFAPSVRVNAVAPGLIRLDEADGESADAAKKPSTYIPLDRFGTGEDIASLVAQLIYDFPYTTGQVFAVDGGVHLV